MLRLVQRGGSRDNFPDCWFGKRRIFQCQYPTNGSGSALGRLSSLLTARNSQGAEWLARFFVFFFFLSTKSPLPSVWELGSEGSGAEGPGSGCAKHLHTFTHGVVIDAHFVDCGREWSFIYILYYIYIKVARFVLICGRWKHGDAKVDDQVENEKVALGLNACTRAHLPSTRCQRQSR